MGFQRLAAVVVLPPASDVALPGRSGSAGAAGSLFLPAAVALVLLFRLQVKAGKYM